MDWLKFVPMIPYILQLWEKGDAIRQKIRNGESVMDLLKAEAPTLVDMFINIAKALFPTITDPAAQVQAGALTIDPSLVMTIQTQLNKVGTSPALVVDGSYGAKTKAAVVAFQTKMGLTPDGWAGKLTQAALTAEVAKLPAT